MTNYVNRYCKWQRHDYGLVSINMIATIYLSNTISTAWENEHIAFNVAMLVMLASIIALYYFAAKTSAYPEAASNHIKILLIVSAIYLLGIVCIFIGKAQLVIWLDVLAVLMGAFLPFFMKGNFNIEIISFPHLVERFELLTIITFGESIVGMTSFFSVEHLSILPILIFTLIILMFASYVKQIHYLVKHERVDRALRLMFSHYFIVIAINLCTIVIHSLHHEEDFSIAVPILFIIALITFLLALDSNRVYYHERYKDIKPTKWSVFIEVIAGLLILIFHSNIYCIMLAGLILVGYHFITILLDLRKKGVEIYE